MDPVLSCLDRFLVTTDWLDLFSNCTQKALAKPVSDRCPISLDTRLEDWGPPLMDGWFSACSEAQVFEEED